MAKRHKDALGIWEGGACNVSGIARSLVAACDEVQAERGDRATDPAIRLIVAQLASLCHVDSTGSLWDSGDVNATNAALQACREAQ